MVGRYIKIGDITIGQRNKFIFGELSGVEAGNVRRDAVQYIDTDGEEYNNVYFNPKNIEISGHIMAGSLEEMERLKRQLIKACSPKEETDMYYFNGVNTYYARARGDSLPEFGKRLAPSWKLPFVAYMVIPSFYWLSQSDIQTNIFTEMPLLKNSSVLPCKFSERVSAATVVNDGDVPAFPVIKIECEVQNVGDIILKNNTTGKELILEYTMTPGETVTADMKEMTVYSSVGGNIIDSVKYISDFWSYECGVNEVSCESSLLHVYSLHRNCYMGV